MASWTKTRDGQWAVIGTVDEIRENISVLVSKKNGEQEYVEVASVGESFVGKFGALTGKECRYGYLGYRQQKTKSRQGYCGERCGSFGHTCSVAMGPCNACDGYDRAGHLI